MNKLIAGLMVIVIASALSLHAAEPVPRPPVKAPEVVDWEFIKDHVVASKRDLSDALLGSLAPLEEVLYFEAGLPSVLDTTDCRSIPGSADVDCVEVIETRENERFKDLIRRIQQGFGARLLACAKGGLPDYPCYQTAIGSMDKLISGLDHLWASVYYFQKMREHPRMGYVRPGTVSSRYLDPWFRAQMVERIALLRKETALRRSSVHTALELSKTYQSRLLIFF